MSVSAELKYLLRSVSNVHVHGGKKNIVINATPRGGSTWLMEIIASQPGMKYYDEPFNIRRNNVQRTGLFSRWEDLQPEYADSKKITDYLNALSKNRYRFMNPPPFRKNYRPLTNRIVFKLHELEHLIDTIAQECNCQILYLVRHPIPNSLSRAVVPRLNQFLTSKYYRETCLNEAQWRDIGNVARTGSDLQRHVVSWCFENIIALRSCHASGWTVLSYEELVINPEKSCDLLYRELDLEDRNRLLASVSKPAANIKMSEQESVDIIRSDSGRARNRRLLTRWKDKVTSQEEQEAFDVLAIFGIDAYQRDMFLPNHWLLNFDDTVYRFDS